MMPCDPIPGESIVIRWKGRAFRLRRQLAAPNSAPPPAGPGYILRFTGTCDEAEFNARCTEQDFWYHTYRFDNGFVRHGDYDIGRDIASYGFPEEMSGMSVLDVGTGSGWFATYFEQRGAEVTTVDARGYSDLDIYGRFEYPDITTEKPIPDRVESDGRPIYYSGVSRGFWIMKEILGLKAEYVNARIYDLRPELFGGKQFDLVFVGAVFMHVRDPVGAVMACRTVCRHLLIANSIPFRGRENDPTPQMKLMAPKADLISWWAPNKACLVHWFKAAAFARVDAERTVHLTVDKPFVDKEGRQSGIQQTLRLVHAYV